VATLLSSGSTRFGTVRSHARRLALALGSTVIASVAILTVAVPAGAMVTKVEVAPGTTAEVGLQPRVVGSLGSAGNAAEFANPNGAAVLHSNQTYAIYWDPTDHYHGDWQGLIDNFFQALGAESGSLNSVFAVDSQYVDKSNQPAAYRSTFLGAYTLTTKYPASGCKDPAPLEEPDQLVIEGAPTPVCLTNEQIQQELKSFIALHGLPKGMGTIYYLLTPPGVTVCLDEAATHCSDYSGAEGGPSYKHSFCSYHSDINPDAETNPEAVANGDANTILYSVVPWTAGGQGDFHLEVPADRTPGYACQDGGLEPTTKPPYEKVEKAKEKSTKEEEEFKTKTAEEKEKILQTERLEGPHEEEPNQKGLGPDGSYDTGLPDLLINQIAIEQQNTVTNPLLNAWQDPSHDEVTDECRNFFARGTLGGSVTAEENSEAGTLSNAILGDHSYYLNTTFNLASMRLPYPGVSCTGGVNLVPEFTAPNPVNAHEVVAFDGMESDIDLDATSYFSGGEVTTTYATYTWIIRGPNGEVEKEFSGFAPGAPACTAPWLSKCAASEFYSFEYGGTYTVTLNVRDVGGNESSITKSITVKGPLRSSEKSAGGSSSSGGAGSSSGAASAGSTPGSGAGPQSALQATAAVLSRSLRNALSGGLLVSYSVNEQVAGRFEVLLAASTARRIGLHGPRATGLPAGTPPEIVVAKAILVTTKGGHNKLKIEFGKSAAARLRHLGKVSLMVRLLVRNASHSGPTSTTVLSLVTLEH